MRTNDAVDSLCAYYHVRGCCGAVFEVYVYGAVVLVLEVVEAFVELGALRGDAFDELVEEVGAVDASLACGVCLGVD